MTLEEVLNKIEEADIEVLCMYQENDPDTMYIELKDSLALIVSYTTPYQHRSTTPLINFVISSVTKSDYYDDLDHDFRFPSEFVNGDERFTCNRLIKIEENGRLRSKLDGETTFYENNLNLVLKCLKIMMT